MEDKFSEIKKDIQLIIDNMAIKNFSEASIKLIEVSDDLDEMFDATDDEVVYVFKLNWTFAKRVFS